MKTLQQQYILINEGKGDKEYFIKSAIYNYPDFITNSIDYDSTVHILKSKGILCESKSKPKPRAINFFKTFKKNINESIGSKNVKEYGNQNEFEKIDKSTQDLLNKQFDNKDEKNIDNVYGQSFLLGFMTEMHDPKNKTKTVDQLKSIVTKNMVKDRNFYHTKASFGIKGIGYTKDHPGLGEPVAPKGKYKSSGYGDLPKKKLNEGLDKDKLTIPKLGQLKVRDKVKYLGKDTNGFKKGEEYEVSRVESNSTFQPTITIKNNDGKKLRTSNLSKSSNSIKENAITSVQIADLWDNIWGIEDRIEPIDDEEDLEDLIFDKFENLPLNIKNKVTTFVQKNKLDETDNSDNIPVNENELNKTEDIDEKEFFEKWNKLDKVTKTKKVKSLVDDAMDEYRRGGNNDGFKNWLIYNPIGQEYNSIFNLITKNTKSTDKKID